MTDQLATETPVDPALAAVVIDPPAEPPATDPNPEPSPSPSPRMIREDVFVREVTSLRGRARETESALEETRRQLRESQELLTRLQRNGTDPNAPPAPTPRRHEPSQHVSNEIEQKAFELNFQRDMQRVKEAGSRAYGQQTWDESVGLLGSFGLDTGDFVYSIMDVAGIDKSHEVVRELVKDPERLVAIKHMSSARRIAEIARISEKMTAPKLAEPAEPPKPAAPPPKTVSRAPEPPPPVQGSASKLFNWDTDQDKLDDGDWSRQFDERLRARAGRR